MWILFFGVLAIMLYIEMRVWRVVTTETQRLIVYTNTMIEKSYLQYSKDIKELKEEIEDLKWLNKKK